MHSLERVRSMKEASCRGLSWCYAVAPRGPIPIHLVHTGGTITSVARESRQTLDVNKVLRPTSSQCWIYFNSPEFCQCKSSIDLLSIQEYFWIESLPSSIQHRVQVEPISTSGAQTPPRIDNFGQLQLGHRFNHLITQHLLNGRMEKLTRNFSHGKEISHLKSSYRP